MSMTTSILLYVNLVVIGIWKHSEDTFIMFNVSLRMIHWLVGGVAFDLIAAHVYTCPSISALFITTYHWRYIVSFCVIRRLSLCYALNICNICVSFLCPQHLQFDWPVYLIAVILILSSYFIHIPFSDHNICNWLIITPLLYQPNYTDWDTLHCNLVINQRALRY